MKMSASDTGGIVAHEAILSLLVERAGLQESDREEVLRRCAPVAHTPLAEAVRFTVDRIFSGADVQSVARWSKQNG